MLELVMVNVAALALLAALSRREGSSYLKQRERVKVALRAANRHDGGPAAPAAAGNRRVSRGWSAALRPGMVGVYALGLVAVVMAAAGEADADPAFVVESDPVLESLRGGEAVPTFELELRGLGELCADGVADAPIGILEQAVEAAIAPPALRMAAIRLEALEDRLDARMEARLVRALTRIESATRRAAVVHGG